MNLAIRKLRENEDIFVLFGRNEVSNIQDLYSTTPYSKAQFKKIRFLDVKNLNCHNMLHPKELRNFSKKTLLILECLNSMNLKNQLHQTPPERVGLYFAGPFCPLPWNSMSAVANEGLSIAKSMKKTFPPKFFLTEGIGISPGQIAIQFGITGPINSFYWQNGGITAELKAFLDLKNDIVDQAVIAIANTYEDPALAHFHSKKSDSKIFLTECAAAYLLTKKSRPSQFKSDNNFHNYYGYLNHLSSYLGDFHE